MSKSSVVFLASALILGIIIGYGINVVITSPKINDLREEIENKNNQINSLQTTVDLLEDNLTSLTGRLTDLTELYDSFVNNTVPKSQFEVLTADLQELTEDYSSLESDYISLEARSSSLESFLEELSEENQELIDAYEALLDKYIEIRVLPWTYFEASSLRVNLTTTSTTYTENTPITGSISIYNEDDQPFNGTFTLILWSEYFASGIKSDKFSVNGKTDYSFFYPFVQGPGTYYLRILEIIDAEEDLVVTSHETKEYSIKITMG